MSEKSAAHAKVYKIICAFNLFFFQKILQKIKILKLLAQ